MPRRPLAAGGRRHSAQLSPAPPAGVFPFPHATAQAAAHTCKHDRLRSRKGSVVADVKLAALLLCTRARRRWGRWRRWARTPLARRRSRGRAFSFKLRQPRAKHAPHDRRPARGRGSWQPWRPARRGSGPRRRSSGRCSRGRGRAGRRWSHAVLCTGCCCAPRRSTRAGHQRTWWHHQRKRRRAPRALRLECPRALSVCATRARGGRGQQSKPHADGGRMRYLPSCPPAARRAPSRCRRARRRRRCRA